jgi:predicted amino acid racemase
MSKGIELVFVTKQETVVLPIVEPTITQGVPVAVKVRYNEPRLNRHNGNIVKAISMD